METNRLKLTADDIYVALQRRHKLPEWILVRELRLGTGFGGIDWKKWEASDRKSWPKNTFQQRIDAWALNCYASNDFRRIAYEIKTSRSDYKTELADPMKRDAAKEISDYFYFAAPRGLIVPDNVPKDCGLLVVYDSGRTEILKRAPRLQPERLDWTLVASLLRNLAQAQRKDLPDDRFEVYAVERKDEL